MFMKIEQNQSWNFVQIIGVELHKLLKKLNSAELGFPIRYNLIIYMK